MFKTMKIRKRIMVILVIIFFVSLPLMTVSSYYILKKNAEREIFETAQVFLFTMESIRKQMAEIARPALMKEITDPNKVVVESSSSAFFSRGVAERVKAKYSQYIFKHISLNPRHKPNKADAFEEGLLKQFQGNKGLTEARGYIKRGDGDYFYLARPVTSKGDCLRCHGSPEYAPREVIDKYGNTAAFGWQEGEVIAALMTYVPTRVAEENAFRALLVFAGFYGAIFLIMLFIIDRIMVSSIIQPIERFARIAEDISRGKMDREFTVESDDEIKTLAEAFTRMKFSLAKAMDILRKR